MGTLLAYGDSTSILPFYSEQRGSKGDIERNLIWGRDGEQCLLPRRD